MYVWEEEGIFLLCFQCKQLDSWGEQFKVSGWHGSKVLLYWAQSARAGGREPKKGHTIYKWQMSVTFPLARPTWTHGFVLQPDTAGLEVVRTNSIHDIKSRERKWKQCESGRDTSETSEGRSWKECERKRQTDKVLGQNRRQRQSVEWWGLGWFYFT